MGAAGNPKRLAHTYPRPPVSICVNEDNYDRIEAFPTTSTGFIIRTETTPEVNLVQTDLNGGTEEYSGQAGIEGLSLRMVVP